MHESSARNEALFSDTPLECDHGLTLTQKEYIDSDVNLPAMAGRK